MSTVTFDRDQMASWYATQHFKTDTGVVEIYYLPENSGDREIRFLEVNTMVGEGTIRQLSPIDYGVDFGTENEHKLLVADVTPNQLSLVLDKTILLPEGWTLDGAIVHRRKTARPDE